ncbi:MAG: hypothetical protein AAB562_03855 [Patescibacteria group bacterium]
MNSDVLFRYAFPAASFAALYFLPAVKSLFILTSMVFSFIVAGLFLLTTKKVNDETVEKIAKF